MSELFWPLFASYLWITGGLGWSYFHEVEDDVQLTPFGRGLIVVLCPFFAAIAIGGEFVSRLRTLLILAGSTDDDE